MESIRGNEISMIFQEASSSLNPVLSINYQVGESFMLHRMSEILSTIISDVEAEIVKSKNPVAKIWKRFSIRMFKRQKSVRESYDKQIAVYEEQLVGLEADDSAEGIRKKKKLAKMHDKLSKHDYLVYFVQHIPGLNLYYRRIKPVIRSMVVQLLKDLGVPNPENITKSYPHELSGGMQQRIVIAIALACHPRLLIADEPTSNLDVTIQAQILEMIAQLKKTKISSVLFITHDLGVVAEVCDRVTVMYAGDSCETADVKDLFSDPLHPYTKALLRSVPKVDQKEALSTIPGIVPNLVHPPTGCRFHPRCEHAMDICKLEKPMVYTKSEGHSVSCHLFTSKEENS